MTGKLPDVIWDHNDHELVAVRGDLLGAGGATGKLAGVAQDVFGHDLIPVFCHRAVMVRTWAGGDPDDLAEIHPDNVDGHEAVVYAWFQLVPLSAFTRPAGARRTA